VLAPKPGVGRLPTVCDSIDMIVTVYSPLGMPSVSVLTPAENEPSGWIRPPLFYPSLRNESKTETKGVEPVRRTVVPKRRPAKLGTFVPTPATKHTLRARRSPRRISYSTARIITIPIGTPLPYITMHVFQTPSICRILAYFGCLSYATISPSSATLAVKCLFLRGGRSKIFTTIG